MLIKGLSRTTWLGGTLVGVIAFLYLVTSVVVVVNAFVWLPTLPPFWYDVQRIIYWPFQPYFDFAFSVLGRSNISYGAYAIVTRAPFLVVSLAVMGLIVRRLVGKPAGAACQ